VTSAYGVEDTSHADAQTIRARRRSHSVADFLRPQHEGPPLWAATRLLADWLIRVPHWRFCAAGLDQPRPIALGPEGLCAYA